MGTRRPRGRARAPEGRSPAAGGWAGAGPGGAAAGISALHPLRSDCGRARSDPASGSTRHAHPQGFYAAARWPRPSPPPSSPAGDRPALPSSESSLAPPRPSEPLLPCSALPSRGGTRSTPFPTPKQRLALHVCASAGRSFRSGPAGARALAPRPGGRGAGWAATGASTSGRRGSSSRVPALSVLCGQHVGARLRTWWICCDY